MGTTFNETLDQIRVVRLELHEEMLKNPQYRALVALDDLLRIIEKATANDVQETIVAEPVSEPEPVLAQVIPETPPPMPVDAPQPVIERKASKYLTQPQALLKVLREKDTPASIGWLLAELELLGVVVGGVSPRKTLGVALSGNKELFRRVEYDGGRWMWGLADRKYPGETTFDHLPATTFKSMRVAKKK